MATPIPGTSDSQSLRWRLVSGSLLCLLILRATCWYSLRHTRIQIWRTLAASVHRVSQLHSGSPLFVAGDSNIWFPFFQLGRSRQADAPVLPIVQEILQSHSLVFRNPPDLPTHRCGAALNIILSSPSLSAPVTVHSGSNCCPLAPLCCPLLSSDHMLCSCRLDIPQAPLSPYSAHSPLPRVHNWSTVVAACHHSLSAWHQSVLAPVSGPLPDFPKRASVLDTLFDFFTRILCGCASHHSRRRPRGSLSGGMMRATTLWLLATAHGVTFAAPGLLRIRLVSASSVNSFTAQFVPPGPATVSAHGTQDMLNIAKVLTGFRHRGVP